MTTSYSGWGMPVDYDRPAVSYGFGPRNTGIPGASRNHPAIDIVSPRGGGLIGRANAVAAQGGRVTYAGRKGGYGNTVEVEHPSGQRTRYSHLDSIDVKVGDVVDRGAALGRVGSTGIGSGAHLDFGVYSAQGTPMDPERALGLTRQGVGRYTSGGQPVTEIGLRTEAPMPPERPTMGTLMAFDPVPQARPDPLAETMAAVAAPPAPVSDPMGGALRGAVSPPAMDDPLGDAMMASPPSTVTSRPSPAAELGTYGSSAPSAPSRDFGAAFSMASPRGLEGVNAIAAAPAPPSMSQAQSLGQMMDVADFPGMAPSPVADPMAEALRGTPAPASPRDRPDPAPAAPNMSLADFGAGMPRGSPTPSLGPTEQMAQMMGVAGMAAPAAPVTAPAAPRERPSPPPTIAPATPRARPEMAPMVAPATPRARPEDVVEEVAAAVAPPTVAPVDVPPETPPPAQMAPPPQPQPQPQPQPVAQPQPQPVTPQPAPAPAPQQRSVPTVAGLAPSINQSIQSAGLPAPPGNMAYGYSPATGIATVSPNAPESVQIAATGLGLFGAINRDTESQIGSRVEDTLGNFALGMTGARVGGFAGGMLGGLVGGPVGAALGAGVGALGGRAIARNAPGMDATGIPGVSPQDAITAGGRQPVSNLDPGVSYSDQRGLAGFFGNLFGRDDEETATAGTSRGISGGFGGFNGFGGGPAGGPGSTTESGSLGGMF